MAFVVASCGDRTGLFGSEPAARDGGGSGTGIAPAPTPAPEPTTTTPPPPPPPPAATCTATNPTPPSHPCTAKIRLDDLQLSTPTCFVDTIANVGDEGTITYPCAGDGAASITFPGGTLSGEARNGRLDTCAGTEFTWIDSCDWTSAQHASGPIPNGPLRFDYAEAPKPGQQHCSSPCSATGTIVIE